MSDLYFKAGSKNIQTEDGIYIKVGSSLDPDAKAFLTAAAITDPIITDAINTFVIGMKAYNLWNKMIAIYPFVGSSSFSHKFNLKDPRNVDAAYRMIFGGTWTHDANGVKAISNGYGDTRWTPSLHGAGIFTISSGSVGFYARTNEQGNFNDFGTRSTNNANSINCLRNRGGALLQYANINWTSPNISSLRITDVRKFYLISRTGTSVTTDYRDGVAIETRTDSATGLANRALQFSCTYLSNGTRSLYSPRNYSFFFIGGALNATEVTNYTNLVNALQVALGRNV